MPFKPRSAERFTDVHNVRLRSVFVEKIVMGHTRNPSAEPHVTIVQRASKIGSVEFGPNGPTAIPRPQHRAVGERRITFAEQLRPCGLGVQWSTGRTFASHAP